MFLMAMIEVMAMILMTKEGQGSPGGGQLGAPSLLAAEDDCKEVDDDDGSFIILNVQALNDVCHVDDSAGMLTKVYSN